MKPITRILLGYAAVVMAAGLAVTFSRGGWAAATAGLLALFCLLLGHRHHRLPAAVLLVVFIGAGAFFAKVYLAKTVSYMTRIERTGDSRQVRLEMWTAAERMWQDHFWWGVGPAHYDYRFREYRPEVVQNRPDRVHNDYLNLLTDWGAVGGLIVLAGMATFVAGLWATRKHVRRSEGDLGGRSRSNRFAFYIGASAGLLALAVHSFVDFNLHIPANAILGVTFLALLTSNVRYATDRYWFNASPPARLLVTCALATGVLYLGWQGWRRANEFVWIHRASSASLLVLERAAILEKAFAAEPRNSETAYNIGEEYRLQSFEGGPENQAQAETAMRWYRRAQQLNPYSGYSDLRTGMCLDWLDRHAEAVPFYRRAETLDPNGYYTIANIGWHFIQVGDYLAAREWLERSVRLQWEPNLIAHSYLDWVDKKLAEDASSQRHLPAGF
jgi:O-antigen ligase